MPPAKQQLGLTLPALGKSAAEVPLLKSTNFELIRTKWEVLASLGGFAELYVHSDPSSALVKLRAFSEKFVDLLYDQHGLTQPIQANLIDKLNDTTFRSAVPEVVISKLHAVRKQGNKAAHGAIVAKSTSQWILKECWALAGWLHVRYGGGKREDIGDFIEPAAPDVSKAKEDTQRRLLRQQVTAQEAELDRVIAELEATRSEAKVAKATTEQLEAALQQSQAVANALDFTEADTRKRLIDTELAEALWDVGHNGAPTNEVGQEVEVDGQPTATGIGYADYVLWESETKPLAVIEAKKTAIDARLGQEQAKLYADSLEKKHGQRPIIFFTNGYDIFIWNDHEDEPVRRLHGFPSRDTLQFMVTQRATKHSASEIKPNPDIAGRMYQLETIKRITEKFSRKRRRALIVLATGTGKTRVAVSLADCLMRANWARRILFLCDRRELRKQADGVFQEYIPQAPRTYVTRRTHKERQHRIYLATYPAMTKVFETFDVGFFDLIIADESHRSIYNRYRHMFEYFDAYQVGLTATPKGTITHDTYDFFDCEYKEPTAFYGYEEAVNHLPPYLVPFKAKSLSYGFIRKGIKYSEMTQEQREEVDRQEEEPESIEYASREIDSRIFNKDTNRRILRNLMENGIRNGDGSEVGKSILFARNHNHAVLLQNLFDEMYPQYGSKFCRVIDNYDPRREQLIDDFKDINNRLTIAISVDMLDTGIDVPEIVNLVFAKPIRSYIKFWQMIGRGTRLCPDLFGKGKDKTHFLIFDHWENFNNFGEDYQEPEQGISKSILQLLFEARVELAETALNKPDLATFESTIKLLLEDLADLPERSVPVREKWKQVLAARKEETLKQFSASTKTMLVQDIAPLMSWRNAEGHRAAYRFDLLIARLETELLRGSSSTTDLRDSVQNEVSRLQMNLNPVRAKADLISEVKSDEFWGSPTVEKLEQVRTGLRGIMQYMISDAGPPSQPKVIDVTEEEALIEKNDVVPNLKGLDQAAYRMKVEKVLSDLFDQNETLQKIKAGQTVTIDELDDLISLILTQDPELDLTLLKQYYPKTADHLELAIRSIIGLDRQAVEQRFSAFVQKHPTLTATQIKFMDMLQSHIARYGSIEIDDLYEAPFTMINSQSVDGVFESESQIDDLLEIIDLFNKYPSDTEAAD